MLGREECGSKASGGRIWYPAYRSTTGSKVGSHIWYFWYVLLPSTQFFLFIYILLLAEN